MDNKNEGRIAKMIQMLYDFFGIEKGIRKIVEIIEQKLHDFFGLERGEGTIKEDLEQGLHDFVGFKVENGVPNMDEDEMKEKLRQNVNAHMGLEDQPPYDPSHLNDPIAMECGWDQLTDDGDSINTFTIDTYEVETFKVKIHKITGQKLVKKSAPTKVTYLLLAILLITGLSLSAFAIYQWQSGIVAYTESLDFAIPIIGTLFVLPTLWQLIMGRPLNSNPRFKFRATVKSYLVLLLFLLMGISLFAFSIYLGWSGELDYATLSNLLIPGMGILFVIASLWMLSIESSPTIFDLHKGYFWKGRESLKKRLSKNQTGKEDNTFIELKRIHALQILSDGLKSKEERSIDYDLNIIPKDGPRIYVISDTRLGNLRAAAETIAEALNVPVWDAT